MSQKLEQCEEVSKMIIINDTDVTLKVNSRMIDPGNMLNIYESAFDTTSIFSGIGSVEITTEYSKRSFECFGDLSASEIHELDDQGLKTIVIKQSHLNERQNDAITRLFLDPNNTDVEVKTVQPTSRYLRIRIFESDSEPRTLEGIFDTETNEVYIRRGDIKYFKDILKCKIEVVDDDRL